MLKKCPSEHSTPPEYFHLQDSSCDQRPFAVHQPGIVFDLATVRSQLIKTQYCVVCESLANGLRYSAVANGLHSGTVTDFPRSVGVLASKTLCLYSLRFRFRSELCKQ